MRGYGFWQTHILQTNITTFTHIYQTYKVHALTQVVRGPIRMLVVRPDSLQPPQQYEGLRILADTHPPNEHHHIHSHLPNLQGSRSDAGCTWPDTHASSQARQSAANTAI